MIKADRTCKTADAVEGSGEPSIVDRARSAAASAERLLHGIVLGAMEQGVLVHNGEEILLFNDRLVELLELPEHICSVGTSPKTFGDFAFGRGDYRSAQGQEGALTYEEMMGHIVRREEYVQMRRPPSGRSIRIDARFSDDLAITTYTDVTEAIERDRIIATTFDAVSQAILIHDGKRIVASNARTAAFLELPLAAVEAGADVSDMVVRRTARGDFDLPRTAQEYARSAQAQIESGHPSSTIQTLGGRRLLCDVQPSGALLVETYTDITRSEEREMLLENMMAEMAQGLLILRGDEIVACNDHVAQMLSVDPDYVRVGRRWMDMVYLRAERGDFGDDPEPVLSLARQKVSAREPYSGRERAGDLTLICEARWCDELNIVTYTDITSDAERERKLRESEARVSYLAHHDALTGLTNRAAFDLTLAQRIADGIPTSLFLIDLDRFKPINDQHGHHVGDKLLQTVGTRLTDTAKSLGQSVDVKVARLGGDEFAVICDRLDEGVVDGFAQSLDHAVARTVEYRGLRLTVGASTGVAATDSADEATSTAEGLLQCADLALYAAKDAGRGHHAVYDATMAEAARQRIRVEGDLRGALARDEIILHYQVQRDLKSSSDIGYEALMRWQHPELGMVAPDSFIPVAEENGLIVELGRYALIRAACDFATFDETTRVAINVSPVQFERSDIVADVTQALDVSGLDPSRMEIEITEQLLITDTESTLATLERLKEMGVGLSLDDFGSGYSSLAYLTRFPFSKLKIDRCFVDRMLLDGRSSALVSSILTLARSLGMRVTAEGVENVGQLASLLDGDCDEVQGFLVGRPVPFEQLRRAKSR